MKKVYIGNRVQLDSKFLELEKQYKDKTVLWLYNNEEFPLGWKILNLLIDELKQSFGGQKIDAILNKHKVIASYAIPSMYNTLTDQELKEWHYHSTKLYTQTNRPVFIHNEWGKVLYELLTEHDCIILIPDLSLIDSESLGTISGMFQQYPEMKQVIISGVANNYRKQDDSNGLCWKQGDVNIQSYINSLQLFDDFEKEILPNSETSQNNTLTRKSTQDIAKANEEYKVHLWLSNDEESNIKENTTYIVEVIKRAYQRFAYKSAIYLGLDALRFKDDFSKSEQAMLYGLIGSAGHFDQLSHHEHTNFDNFLIHHLTEAINLETDPILRCSLHYRLVYAIAEREDDFETSVKWVEQEINEASNSNLSSIQKAHQQAWGYSISGHININKGEEDAFNKDIEQTFSILELEMTRLFDGETYKDLDPLELKFWQEEFCLSHFHFAAHQVFFGDELDMPDYSRKWIGKAKESLAKVSDKNRFDVFHWIEYHRSKLELNKALECCDYGIEDAYKHKNTLMYLYQFSAADICYRIGDYEKAADYYENAKRLRPHFHDVFGALSIDLLIGYALLKTDKYKEAEPIFIAELNSEKDTEPNMFHVKLWTYLALISAKEGKDDLANERINKAIEYAVEIGDKNILVFVASHAGEVASIIGNKEDAINAYAQSLDIAKNEEGILSNQLDNANVLYAVLGHFKHSGYTEQLLIELLKNTKANLILDSGDGWALLHDFLPYIATVLNSGNPIIIEDEDLKEGIKLLKQAANERKDCKKHVQEVEALLS